MENITSYFRNAITASSQSTIDYKDGKFITISWEEISGAQIRKEVINQLWSRNNSSEYEEENECVKKSVVIALKTITTKFSNNKKTNEDIEEMTSILFLPAQVDVNGNLFITSEENIPWIPREYLEPMEEQQLSIGNVDEYDQFFENSTDQRNQIDTFEKYIKYSIDLYESVTHTNFTDNNALNTDGKYYIFIDSTVYATFHIAQLYNHLVKKDDLPLYQKITSCGNKESRILFENYNIDKMMDHVGQMGGEYSLSPSQRKAINHCNEINDGEVLAVTGPPGTGKTTLLQSVVANMYVERALKKEKAPIIVASSTNNQAVTNIIDSFGKIKNTGISNLEKRWISGVKSFVTYFPSKGKVKEATENKYQFDDVLGSEFTTKIESSENRIQSLEIFYSEYEKLFDNAEKELSTCLETLHFELLTMNEKRVEFLKELKDLQANLSEYSYREYLVISEKEIARCKNNIEYDKTQCDILINQNKKNISRKIQWDESYNKISWYVRLFKTLHPFKNKIANWVYSFMQEDELEFLKRNMNIYNIDVAYEILISNNDQKINNLKNHAKVNEDRIDCIKKDLSNVKSKMQLLKGLLEQMLSYKSANYDQNSVFETLEMFDICKINDLLDRVRYIEFWLAVHYYECRWLYEKNPILGNQKGKTFKNVLEKTYQRNAMLSPCMVMTFFMLPKQFYAYDGNEKKNFYMYNFIDLLVVDEAGQISPEIACASFSLAKRAIVVGDEQQIPPVWGTTRGLDISMAISNNVIVNKKDFDELEKNGLNCSQSSLMKVACQTSAFDENGYGLFLSEHRRCYNEIIQYCNELVYNGKLDPLRGNANDDKNSGLINRLPAMGHKEISNEVSQKNCCSRINEKEAKEVVKWIQNNYSEILKKYATKTENEMKEILGIITPFKSQKILIKSLIKSNVPEYSNLISVGTAHTFQGAERKIIIFSSVYGSKDGCYFINLKRSLMNVAVSRAKDSFLVFGDSDCLVGGKTTAAGLLKEMTREIVDESLRFDLTEN